MHSIIKFFDKLEDRVSKWFSHKPILYGFVGGVGVVLFWRGVWHTTDWLSAVLFDWRMGSHTVDLTVFPDGPISFIVGSILLLVTGLFVSTFLGNEITISGLRGERRLAEKTEVEVRTETGALGEIRDEIKKIGEQLAALEKRK